mgnify:CR=1 FL=1
MAINKQPVARKCRALGVSPAEMGYGKKQSKRNPVVRRFLNTARS